MLNALADTVAERLKGSLQPSVSHKQQQKNTQENNESGIASHSCPLCEKLMSGPRHTPMAAIPCGHTFCQACLRDCKKCPTCQTVVKSTAVNTVIQQIISDFKMQKEKERLQKLEEQTRQYVEEYQSLTLRCNALNGKDKIRLWSMSHFFASVLNGFPSSKDAGVSLIFSISSYQWCSWWLCHKAESTHKTLFAC